MEETKRCSHCGQEIKATAKKCRYCGEWIDDSVKSQSNTGVNQQPRQSAPKNNTPIYILIGVIVIAVIVIVALLLRPSASDKDGQLTNPDNDEVVAKTIPPANHPYTIDEVLDKIAEHDANETEEEKANEPWRIRLKELQGTYFRCDEQNHGQDYGKIVISRNMITQYVWNENTNDWDIEFGSEFTLFTFHEDSYMDGYNLIYADQYRNDARMCSGDCNDDGRMDLWQSDSMYWTKQ